MAEVEFRTGKREIPDYQAELMAGIDTHKLTYEQALVEMNKSLERNHVTRSFDRIVAEHFARNGGPR